MAKVTSKEKAEFKKKLEKLLTSDDYKFSRTLMVSLVESAQTIIDSGVDSQDITLEIWIIPKLRNPADGDPANYHTRSTSYFVLDFVSLHKLIVSAISPVYSNDNQLVAFNQQLLSSQEFRINYRFKYPKNTSVPEHCEIQIPIPQTTE